MFWWITALFIQCVRFRCWLGCPTQRGFNSCRIPNQSVIYMTSRNVNFQYGDLMRVTRGVQAVRNPKTIARLWRRSWLCKLLNQKGDPS
ncbi:TPA: hypothetical protein ACM2MD_000025 [Raoultella planticola]|uniref:hypothetical protein n=1 Tax=Raoultella ornithinolytica TaxID=54291 RepID=UPI00177B9958|nr:hypothetical protein [Raoultella planticola]MBE0015112.1 hypothetical protein [Raoultella planticola]